MDALQPILFEIYKHSKYIHEFELRDWKKGFNVQITLNLTFQGHSKSDTMACYGFPPKVQDFISIHILQGNGLQLYSFLRYKEKSWK